MNGKDGSREAAEMRLKARRDFRNHVVAYIAVNAVLVIVWAATGAGYFWPIWPIMGWGIGLALHGWSISQRPISEEDIRREMERED